MERNYVTCPPQRLMVVRFIIERDYTFIDCMYLDILGLRLMYLWSRAPHLFLYFEFFHEQGLTYS